jgi:uncharacterized protein
MSISIHAASVETFVRTLKNLEVCIDKGAAHAEQKKFDPAVLLNSRLAPDMFTLIRQVQLSADFAKNSSFRLAGIDPPKIDDAETSVADLKARIAKTIELISGIDKAKFDGAETRDIKIPLRDRTLELKGTPFLLGFGLPNFYFHVSMAYAILRHNGVELGKKDFLGG